MFNKYKDLWKRVINLEQNFKQLSKPKIDYHTNTVIDYLIGDDINCPICGTKMDFVTDVTELRYCPKVIRHTLRCRVDGFTVCRNSLKDCIDELKTIKVTKTKSKSKK